MFLNGAADKLKKEQEKRKADLQRKQASERRAAAVIEAQKAARAEEERRERAEELQRKAEERAALELVLANNEGVRWESRLIGREKRRRSPSPKAYDTHTRRFRFAFVR